MWNFSLPQNFESELLRRPLNTLGIGMGALWYAIGIHFGILKLQAKFFAPKKKMKKIFNGAHTTPEGSGWGPFWCPQHFTNDSSRRPSNTIRIGIGTLWCAKGIYFRILKSHAKTFAPANFWKRFPTTPIQYLRDRDGRPLICDRASFRKSRVAGFFFRVREILKTIFHCAHPIP